MAKRKAKAKSSKARGRKAKGGKSAKRGASHDPK